MRGPSNPIVASDAAPAVASAHSRPMRLRYGLNIGNRWRELAANADRAAVLTRIREARTNHVRVFLDEVAASPSDFWPQCVALLDAIVANSATPVVALSCPGRWPDASAARVFAQQCGELVERACAHWGPEVVRSWFWSLGDEPNSPFAYDGLSFAVYRDLYELAASRIQQHLGPAVGRPRIGGPCIDGFQPFWFDWLWRFVEEIDDSLIGFVAWNRYGDWREPGAWGAPANPAVFERLLLSRTSEYWSRAEAIRAVVDSRGILSVCSELNAHSHTDPVVSGHLNRGMFGAVYYASALIELMRGGADGEFLWAGASADGPYAAIDGAGSTTPTYQAKKLIAGSIHYGDQLSFPLDADPAPGLDAVLATNARQDEVAVLVCRETDSCTVSLARWPELHHFSRVAMLSEASGGQVHAQPVTDLLSLPGYAVGLLTR